MSQRKSFRRVGLGVAAVGLLGATSVGCLDRPVSAPETRLQSGVQLPVVNNAVDSVDILFEIDNSNSMRDNQAAARAAGGGAHLAARVAARPNPRRPPVAPPVRSLHVGVVSSDLGTPGVVVPSCANSDSGDDGLLNPIRNGQAIRTHQPWTTAPPGIRPMRCMNNPQQYPNFLTFDAMSTNAAEFREDFVCNAFLSTGGCGLEQPLESAYRALVVRNPRAQPGNTDPNGGFVRDGAVLGIVVLTDEDDGSVRDCRYQERGDPDGDCRPPRGDGLGVYDTTNDRLGGRPTSTCASTATPRAAPKTPPGTSTATSTPRAPTAASRGSSPDAPTSSCLAPSRGCPTTSPSAAAPHRLGRAPRRQPRRLRRAGRHEPRGPHLHARGQHGPRLRDPRRARLPPRGHAYDPSRPSCDTRRSTSPGRPAASPSWRGASPSGTTTASWAPSAAARTTTRSPTSQAHPASPGCVRMGDPTPVRVNCVVRETLPEGMTAAQQCTSARGRRPAGRDPETNREQCLVDQVSVPVGGMPSGSAQGFYYDTTVDPTAPDCRQRISFTSNAELATGATALIDCVQNVGATN
jgi:hypothetical protein